MKCDRCGGRVYDIAYGCSVVCDCGFNDEYMIVCKRCFLDLHKKKGYICKKCIRDEKIDKIFNKTFNKN